MNKYFTQNLINRLKKAGVIVVLTIDKLEDAVPLAKVLEESGILAMELTLRTPCALGALELIRNEVPSILAGVGTVLKSEQIKEIKERNAAFALSPGCNADVIDAALDLNFPLVPGIATPSDMETAFSRGCRVLKYFPAEGMGGLAYLRSINGPYKFLNAQFISLGGLNEGNIRSYFECPEILAVGGSWIAPTDMINKKDWTGISKNAKNTMKIFREVRE